MTDAIYPQVRIVPSDCSTPRRVERLMNLIIATGGVRRMLMNGQSLPAVGPVRAGDGVSQSP